MHRPWAERSLIAHSRYRRHRRLGRRSRSACRTLVAELPRSLRAAVFVVLHVSRGRSVLPEILTRAGRLPASHAADGDRLEYGHVYVARPDHHLTLEDGIIRVVHGPTENGYRPAVDPLFRFGRPRVWSEGDRRHPHGGSRRWNGWPRRGQGSRRRRHRPGSRRGVRVEHAAECTRVRAGRSRTARPRDWGLDCRADQRAGRLASGGRRAARPGNRDRPRAAQHCSRRQRSAGESIGVHLSGMPRNPVGG